MAGTATGWDTLEVIQTQAQIWASLAIPGAGAELTLYTDGTPDATANPSAKHLGHTAEGASLLVKPSYNEFSVDESPAPFKRNVGGMEIAIAANLVQIEDFDLAELLLPGVATQSAPSGKKKLTFGLKAVTYTSIAIIWPRETDSTKFGAFHIYRAANDEGLAAEFGRTKMAGAPVSFKGHAITSRATADQYGAYWIQT
ncbi:MAG TPA: hypothetical protein VF297_05240 [Pyrinomonadaceae bacterium]